MSKLRGFGMSRKKLDCCSQSLKAPIAARVGAAELDSLTNLQKRSEELEHRLKNVLSNILALVGRAKCDATVDFDVMETLSSRIKAFIGVQLAFSHDAKPEKKLRSLITSVLTDVYGRDRFSLRGKPHTLNARAAAAMTSVLHELATNAAKYGALSSDRGRIELSWEWHERGAEKCFKFRWREFGGPKVFGNPPDGFGAYLITSTVKDGLNGQIDRDWRRDGLFVELSVPLEFSKNGNRNIRSATF